MAYQIFRHLVGVRLPLYSLPPKKTLIIVMNVEEIRDYVLAMPDVEECFPFGEETAVYKTAGRMFLLMGLTNIPLQINVKCEPDVALELRGEYPDHVLPGYHMNKAHWNTLICEGRLTRSFISQQIVRSHGLVGKKKKK